MINVNKHIFTKTIMFGNFLGSYHYLAWYASLTPTCFCHPGSACLVWLMNSPRLLKLLVGRVISRHHRAIITIAIANPSPTTKRYHSFSRIDMPFILFLSSTNLEALSIYFFWNSFCIYPLPQQCGIFIYVCCNSFIHDFLCLFDPFVNCLHCITFSSSIKYVSICGHGIVYNTWFVQLWVHLF